MIEGFDDFLTLAIAQAHFLLLLFEVAHPNREREGGVRRGLHIRDFNRDVAGRRAFGLHRQQHDAARSFFRWIGEKLRGRWNLIPLRAGRNHARDVTSPAAIGEVTRDGMRQIRARNVGIAPPAFFQRAELFDELRPVRDQLRTEDRPRRRKAYERRTSRPHAFNRARAAVFLFNVHTGR